MHTMWTWEPPLRLCRLNAGRAASMSDGQVAREDQWSLLPCFCGWARRCCRVADRLRRRDGDRAGTLGNVPGPEPVDSGAQAATPRRSSPSTPAPPRWTAPEASTCQHDRSDHLTPGQPPWTSQLDLALELGVPRTSSGAALGSRPSEDRKLRRREDRSRGPGAALGLASQRPPRGAGRSPVPTAATRARTARNLTPPPGCPFETAGQACSHPLVLPPGTPPQTTPDLAV